MIPKRKFEEYYIWSNLIFLYNPFLFSKANIVVVEDEIQLKKILPHRSVIWYSTYVMLFSSYKYPTYVMLFSSYKYPTYVMLFSSYKYPTYVIIRKMSCFDGL